MPEQAAEQDLTVPPQQEKPTGKIVSAGKPVIMKSVSLPQQQPQQQDTNAGANAIDANTGAGGNNEPAPAPATPEPSLTDAQLTAYFKSQGIDYEGIEKLREKFNYTAPKELSEEEKKLAANTREQKLVDLFVKGGGTIEQYVAIKAVADAELNQLSITNTKAELKAAGFTDEQVDEIIKERYYQISDEDLEKYEEEADREFLKKKKEYGAKKLANRASYTKKQAQEILAGLTKAAESQDTQEKDESILSSKIDEQFKTLPRKVTLEIGTVDGKPIPPVDYEVSETDISEVQAMLKDPAKRQQFFYNQDGGLNLTNIATVLTRNKMLESAVKAAYHEGGSRQVAAFEQTFPAKTPQEIGVGGSPKKETGQKGKLVSWSKPTIINRPSQQHR